MIKSETTRKLLERVQKWESMTPGRAKSDFWDLRINFLFGEWFREGKPDLAHLQGLGYGWIEKGSSTAGPKEYPGQQPQETIKIDGQLEIDTRRGVIYFHSSKTGVSVLRICQLSSSELTRIFTGDSKHSAIDITNGYGVSYTK